MVDLVLEGNGLGELDVVEPRVDRKRPAKLLLFPIIPHNMYPAAISIGCVAEDCLEALAESEPLKNLID